MKKVSFDLQCKNNYLWIKESDSLNEIWKHIRNFVNEPRSYIINQINDEGRIECSISAFYLIENFKDEASVPLLISDINQS